MRADRFVGASKGAVRAVLLGLFILGAACLLVPPAMSQLVCPGDCNWNGVVSIDEIIVAVNIALGLRNRHDCPPADVDNNGDVTIDEIISAVHRALQGCEAAERRGPFLPALASTKSSSEPGNAATGTDILGAF